MPLESLSSTTGLRSPLRVRNNERNTTVFTKQVNGDPLKIIFGAAGSTGDVQRVPFALAEDIDFLNALDQGVLTVIDGPAEVVQALQPEAATIREERQREEARKATSVMDRSQDRDMVGTKCVGPAAAGRQGECGRPLLQNARQQAEVPPLCPEHEHLAPNFHLVETGSKGEGATESRDGVVRREWRQATLTAPVKEQ